MTTEDLRTSAIQLRELLGVLDDGEVEGSSRERAFIAGALRAIELMQEDLDQAASLESISRDRRA